MKKFNWEKFDKEQIIVKFSSEEEVKDFCENAFIREYKFYNKATKIENFITEWKKDNSTGLDINIWD